MAGLVSMIRFLSSVMITASLLENNKLTKSLFSKEKPEEPVDLCNAKVKLTYPAEKAMGLKIGLTYH